LRVDKMTLAALEIVLRLYLQGKSGVIPTVHMLRLSGEELRSRAQALACRLVEAFPQGAFEAIPVEDAAGGGAFPEHPLPGWAVAMTFPGLSSSTLQRKLRKGAFPAVVGIWNDRVTAHVRTLLDGDEERLVQALNDLVGEGDEGLER
jgi:L-seryl-tRNA(Ser) seleniumtransferase